MTGPELRQLTWRKRMVLRDGKKVELMGLFGCAGKGANKSRMPARSLSWWWENGGGPL